MPYGAPLLCIDCPHPAGCIYDGCKDAPLASGAIADAPPLEERAADLVRVWRKRALQRFNVARDEPENAAAASSTAVAYANCASELLALTTAPEAPDWDTPDWDAGYAPDLLTEIEVVDVRPLHLAAACAALVALGAMLTYRLTR